MARGESFSGDGTTAATTNVAKCIRAMERAVSRPSHLPGLVGFYGPSGYGKSIAAAYVANEPASIRANPPTPDPDCSALANCVPLDLVTYDFAVWERSLAGVDERLDGENTGGLLNPVVCVDGPAGISGTYTVTIAWRGGAALPNDAGVACGAGATGAGGERLYGDADEFRRTVSIPAFIRVPPA